MLVVRERRDSSSFVFFFSLSRLPGDDDKWLFKRVPRERTALLRLLFTYIVDHLGRDQDI